MAKKVGRNAPCPCGSGKKFKRCCLANAERQHANELDRGLHRRLLSERNPDNYGDTGMPQALP